MYKFVFLKLGVYFKFDFANEELSYYKEIKTVYYISIDKINLIKYV